MKKFFKLSVLVLCLSFGNLSGGRFSGAVYAQDGLFHSANSILRAAFKISTQKTVFSGVNPETGSSCDVLIDDRRFSDDRVDELQILGQFEEAQDFEHLGFVAGPATQNLQISKTANGFAISTSTSSWAFRGTQELSINDLSRRHWPRVIFKYTNGAWHSQGGNQLICDQLKRVSG